MSAAALDPASLPPAPARFFASDNAAGALPEVMEAVAAVNDGSALAYGEDPWTAALVEDLRARFDAPAEVLLCWGGTGANVVGLGTAVAQWQAVICPATAHLVVDECGAPERFLGASMITVPSDDGKLRPDDLSPFLHWLGDHHHPQPAVVSVSQATEEGTTYTPDELTALGEAAHAHGLRLHVDGARLANALARHGGSLADLTAGGVDVLTLGATKAGGLYGEAVVLLDPELAATARFHQKQAGQLPSKARFIAAQLSALLAEDRWIRHADHANRMAAVLADAVEGLPGLRLAGRPEVNSVFAHLPVPAIEPLQAWSPFWEWDLDAGLVRWMTSWQTTAEDVERFSAGVAAALHQLAGD